MTISSATKDGGYIIIVEDGITKKSSIIYEDTVCSVPPTGYTKVGVIYVDEVNNKLVIQHNGSTTEIELGAAIAHDLGGASHNADTLGNLNSKVSDATLLDQGTIMALALALGS